MPALNFLALHATDVETGKKRQSIRAYRKRLFVQGDRLYLYTGMRTKSCRKLGETTATSVTDIKIYRKVVVESGGELSRREVTALAKADGFRSVREFIAFFKKTHGLPFCGQLIQW